MNGFGFRGSVGRGEGGISVLLVLLFLRFKSHRQTKVTGKEDERVYIYSIELGDRRTDREARVKEAINVRDGDLGR